MIRRTLILLAAVLLAVFTAQPPASAFTPATPTFCAYTDINYAGTALCFGDTHETCWGDIFAESVDIHPNTWSSLKTRSTYHQGTIETHYHDWELQLYDSSICTILLEKFSADKCASCLWDNDFRDGGLCCGVLGNYNDRVTSFRVHRIR